MSQAVIAPSPRLRGEGWGEGRGDLPPGLPPAPHLILPASGEKERGAAFLSRWTFVPMTDTLVSSASKEVVIGFERRFVMIGERINPTGESSSRPRWRRAITTGWSPRRSPRSRRARRCSTSTPASRWPTSRASSPNASRSCRRRSTFRCRSTRRSSRRSRPGSRSTRASRSSIRSPARTSGSSGCCRW